MTPLGGSTQAPVDGITVLQEGRLYALSNPIELDGRPTSTHPRSARGWATVNCYLVLDGSSALLVDSGFPIHRARLLEQLAALFDGSRQLAILFLRISEFNSVGNARAIADRFGVQTVIGGYPDDLAGWGDFDPKLAPFGTRTPSGGLADVGWASLTSTSQLPVGGLEVLRPELQLLPTYWIYDRLTGTVLTSDMFTHVLNDRPDGPTVCDDSCPPPVTDQIAEFLLDSRFWWLAGANTAPLRASLVDVFGPREIRTIGPAWGSILHGRRVVDDHVRAVDGALAELGARSPIGPDLVPDRGTVLR